MTTNNLPATNLPHCARKRLATTISPVVGWFSEVKAPAKPAPEALPLARAEQLKTLPDIENGPTVSSLVELALLICAVPLPVVEGSVVGVPCDDTGSSVVQNWPSVP